MPETGFTPAAQSLLTFWGRMHAQHALTCPAISREAAKAYGHEEATHLVDEIEAGFFTHVDGEPLCVAMAPGPEKATQKQLTLGGRA